MKPYDNMKQKTTELGDKSWNSDSKVQPLYL